MATQGEHSETSRGAGRIAATIIRTLLGAVFVAAAWLKASDFASFSRDLWLEYRLPRLLSGLAFFLPAIELAIGLALVLGVNVRATAKAATAALVVFSAAILFGLARGDLADCGCLGEFVAMDPGAALLRNAVLAAGAIWLGWRAPIATSGRARAKLWAVAISACVASGLTGTSAHQPFVDRTTVRVGERFPGEPFTQAGIDITHGTWVVFGFSATCGHCWDAIHQAKTLAHSSHVRVVGVTASDAAQLTEFERALEPGFPIVQIDSGVFGDMQRKLPTSWLVREGVVIEKREGSTYSAPSLDLQLDG